jgi:hypothetical protein
MMRQHDPRDTRVSNWTRSTGTSPGHREVQAAAALDTVQRPAQAATS